MWDTAKIIVDAGLGGMSFALFLRLGKVVSGHEIRITDLEETGVSRPRRRRR